MHRSSHSLFRKGEISERRQMLKQSSILTARKKNDWRTGSCQVLYLDKSMDDLDKQKKKQQITTSSSKTIFPEKTCDTPTIRMIELRVNKSSQRKSADEKSRLFEKTEIFDDGGTGSCSNIK